MPAGQVTIFGLTMDLSVLLLILALVCLFLGYVIGAFFSIRGMNLSLSPGRRSPREDEVFLKGIHSLLANDTEQAIAELTRAVQMDTEQVETYVALGHLYRSKGQFERAIAIRQSIIARPNLPAHVRVQALYDLGVDFRQGGFISRAIEAFEQVLKENDQHLPALKELEQVFETLKDWDRAAETQRRIDKITGQDNSRILAHLKAERGKQLMAEGNTAEARSAFKKALGWDRNCANALLGLGDLHLAEGELRRALAAWRKIGQAAPSLSFLALNRVADQEWGAKETVLVEEFILGLAEESRDPGTHLLAARHLAARGKEEETVRALRRLLDLEPGFLPAHQALGQIFMDRGNIEEILSAYQALLPRLPGGEPEFQCQNCGVKSGQFFWQCPSCLRWDTIARRG